MQYGSFISRILFSSLFLYRFDIAAEQVNNTSRILTGSRPPPTCVTIEKNVDYIGNDIGKASSSTPQGCCTICGQKSGCKAFSWTKLNGGTCWLKSAKTKTKSTPNVQSATLVNVAPTCGTIENNVDYIGNDIGNVLSNNAEGCCDLCKAKIGCSVYSWTNLNGGTCWLKSGRGNTAVKTGVRSATLKLGDTYCGVIENNIEYFGNDFANVLSSNAEGCCDICKGTKGCNAFSWSNLNGGTCWLKNGKGSAIAKTGVRSATLNVVQPACGFIENDVDYIGNDLLGNAKSPDAELCCEICKANRGCNAFSWTNLNGGTCWLKSGKGNSVAKAGVRSGIVRTPPGSTCTLEFNVDYTGNDIKNVYSPSFDSCCSSCRSIPGCKAYTWTNLNGGTCWLKSARTGTTTKTGALSGTVN